MHSRTPLQMKTAICWACEFFIRGTLSASEMVAKDRTPSKKSSQTSLQSLRHAELTDCGDDLGLEAELVAEATSEVVEAAFAIARNIRGLPDVVEHVSTCEEQDPEQAHGRPKVAVLQDGNDVGRSDSEEGHDTKHGGGDGDDLDPVDGSVDGGLGCIGGELAR
jgi:hypothetical protein